MISLNWVKDYVDLENEDLQELAVKVTSSGINIEKVITNHIDKLVIGEIVKCDVHPNSDHLHVCEVNIGTKTTQIVCGAPNVRVGLKVIVSLPGAILPGDFEIKPSVIRGVESNGMMCALYELGLEEKNDKTYAKGICELGRDAVVGTDPLKYLGLDDTLYELDVHKHRNNDCYYHIGFAYEIASILNKKVTLPEIKFNEINSSVKNNINLKVETPKCPYYSAKMVSNVEIKESPDFIKKRLISAGLRPINNVVDISNYVMLEFGQPLHFFDKDTLGNNILVRDAKDNEEIITLDGKKRILDKNDIVITNGTKPVCIAGVMGGENTEITENTKNILIESAIFDSVSIRNTAQKLNLKSEASIRYGKGLNYEYTHLALLRACQLLEKYASAKVLSDIVEYDKIDKTPKEVEFTPDEVNKMLGIEISKDEMEKELDRLMFDYILKDNKFKVTIPNRRLDIEPNVNDIAEEIGRLYGYQNLVSTLPKVSVREGKYVGDVKYRKIISKRLRSLGINECKTYTLVSKEMSTMFNYSNKNQISLPNPMSADKSVIRTTLIPSLINTYNYNKKRKVNDICLYEISKTYDESYNEESLITVLMSGNYINNSITKEKITIDYYSIKGVLENILDYLGLKNRYSYEEANRVPNMHPYITSIVKLDREPIGIIGKVHPKTLKDDVYVFEISLNKLMKPIKPLKYKQASIYPSITKDVAFVSNKNVKSAEIELIIKKVGGRLLTDISVFDVYTGENVKEDEKCIAYSLTFSDSSRTLEEKEVMDIFNKIITEVEKTNIAKLRD